MLTYVMHLEASAHVTIQCYFTGVELHFHLVTGEVHDAVWRPVETTEFVTGFATGNLDIFLTAAS